MLKPRRSREHGIIDTTDLVVGLIMIPVVALVTFAVGAMFAPEDDTNRRTGAMMLKQRDNLVVPPDVEEVEMRWKAALKTYNSACRFFVKGMMNARDNVLREKYRQWALYSLSNVGVELDELNRLIDLSSGSKFNNYKREIRKLKTRIDSDMEQVRSRNILGS